MNTYGKRQFYKAGLGTATKHVASTKGRVDTIQGKASARIEAGRFYDDTDRAKAD